MLTRRLERRRVVSLRQDVRGGAEGRHLAEAPSSFYQPLLLLLHPGLFCRLHSNEGGGCVTTLCNTVCSSLLSPLSVCTPADGRAAKKRGAEDEGL